MSSLLFLLRLQCNTPSRQVNNQSMLESATEIFSRHVFTALTAEVDNARGLLVKKHSENLETNGDFSFPNSVNSWLEHLKENEHSSKKDVTFLQYLGKDPSYLIEVSSNWNLRVKNVKEDTDAGRVCLFLERPLAISVGLTEARKNHLLITQRMEIKNTSVQTDHSEPANCITSLRVKYVSEVVKNLCAICSKDPDILVTSRSSAKSPDTKVLLCGSVLNAKTGSKETTITAEDFISLRQAEMTLIAQHKYGIRVTTDSKWNEFLAHLGESAVAFELLQGRASTTVKVNFDNIAAGSSKGASFVLYNCARLETIIRTYDDKVKEGIYPVLPNFEKADLSLLTLEDEWTLIFKYILGFPSMLSQCIDITDTHCDFRPHNLCNFLSSMVRVFSQYYRRTRILVEPRKHLLPIIHARMHMMIVLNDTLKMCLKILNIKSVSQM